MPNDLIHKLYWYNCQFALGKNWLVCHFARNITSERDTQNQKGHEAQVDLNTPQNTDPESDHGAQVRFLNTHHTGNDHGATHRQKDTNIRTSTRNTGRDPKVLKSIQIRRDTILCTRKAHVKPRNKLWTKSYIIVKHNSEKETIELLVAAEYFSCCKSSLNMHQNTFGFVELMLLKDLYHT